MKNVETIIFHIINQPYNKIKNLKKESKFINIYYFKFINIYLLNIFYIYIYIYSINK